jgi:imidazolonepropionase-like amidohydrolase
VLLIKNADIHPMTGRPAFHGYLLADPPFIREVGSGEPPPHLTDHDALQVVDADGAWLMPGLIDAHCHVGLFNDGLTFEGHDGNEATDPVTPQLLATDGIYQDDACFPEALAGGVTTVMTGPGSANVLAGSFALLRTAGRTVEDMTVIKLAAMKAALGENPKQVYGRKDKSPITRMATAAILRDALAQTQAYIDEKDFLAKEEKPMTRRDGRWEALAPVLTGERMLKIHAHRTDDILTAVRIANEFGLHYTIDHCTEGYLIADLLALEYQAGLQQGCGLGKPGLGRLAGVITGPLLSDRSKPELRRSTIRNPGILAAAGIPVAIMTDHPVVPVQYLTVSAALAVKAGMTEQQALEAMTITSARLCGADKILGSIEAGKLADLVLFSGNPLDFRSTVRMVFLQGKPAFSET